VRKCSATADARAFITDVAEATVRPNIIVAPQTDAFGLTRMFQTLGERARPNLQVVRTLDDALRVLGIQSPHFEPLA
jgi:hypothetical protein